MNFFDWLNTITNNPTFIALVTACSSIGGGLVFLRRSSYGRKSIKLLTDLTRNSEAKVEATCKKVDKKLDELDKKQQDIESQFNVAKLELIAYQKSYIAQLDFFVDSMYTIIQLIPNEKVRAALSEFKVKYEEKKKEVNLILGEDYSVIKEELDKKNSEIEELKNQMTVMLQRLEVLEHGEKRVND